MKLNLFSRIPGVAGRLLCAGFFVVVAGCASPRYERSDEPRTVVVWVSIDGVRPDYIPRSETPNLDRLMEEGAYSMGLAPIFPSITFPNHVSQATGVTVDQHGVPLNSFYDRERDRKYFYPGPSRLLEAEPIWTTVQRQGLRVAVFDWVLSHRQQGEHATSYFGDSYDGGLTDRQRVGQLLRTWRKDRGKEPLQLLMSYMVTPDKVGHEFGPDAPEVEAAMRQVDIDVGWFVKHLVKLFDQRMQEGDSLVVMFTSDHGMSEVHTAVHPNLLAGVDREEEQADQVVVMTTGNLAHYFLHKIEDEEARATRKAKLLAEVGRYSFARAYTQDMLPERWGYAHPNRVGDVVVVLETGYTFSRRAREVSVAISETGGPLGMHGYDVEDNPEMNGIAIFWRYPEQLGGHDLGPTHSLQLHATVAKLLGVEPSEAARPDVIELPGW
ncbi:MAG TPA: alkaline phosphatase family protein [Kiritimatiellia bacterium]|nr:alkaline phosphatase family protein [Kiritimatiellia bacterium]